jgi:hypothetical protein
MRAGTLLLGVPMRRLASSLVLGVSLCLAGSLTASAQTAQQPAQHGQPAKKQAPAQKKGGWEPLETVPVTGERTPGYVGIGQQGFSQPYDNTAAGQANQGLPSPFGMGNNITSQPTR